MACTCWQRAAHLNNLDDALGAKVLDASHHRVHLRSAAAQSSCCSALRDLFVFVFVRREQQAWALWGAASAPHLTRRRRHLHDLLAVFFDRHAHAPWLSPRLPRRHDVGFDEFRWALCHTGYSTGTGQQPPVHPTAAAPHVFFLFFCFFPVFFLLPPTTPTTVCFFIINDARAGAGTTRVDTEL